MMLLLSFGMAPAVGASHLFCPFGITADVGKLHDILILQTMVAVSVLSFSCRVRCREKLGGLWSSIFYTPASSESDPTCLLPLKWMTHEQAKSCKKNHLKVASGATVRTLLHENIIYCSTVSRPLVSVRQLNGMLDLRMIWDDSSPKIIACSGGLRYILIEAALFHNLPVISHTEFQALLGAIHDFTQTGTLYNAATWAKRLGRKLSLFHWSTLTGSLLDAP